MQSIGVCGHFGGGKEYFDGQTIKTKNITEELIRQYGANCIKIVDTYHVTKRFPQLLFKIVHMMFRNKKLVILPAQNGLNTYVRLMIFLNLILKRKIHYVVIGGWLPQFLEDKPRLATDLKTLAGIYVETSTMKKALEKMGFANVKIIPNFKNISVLTERELVYSNEKPLKLCTFSRVMKEKGIEDAVNAINQLNLCAKEPLFTLDIYGQIDVEQTEWFARLEKDFSPFIKYKGAIPPEKSVDVLKEYYALLFPTNFFTEGIPGTIIDAYSAGVPVICARWESFSDVVEDEKTGFGFEFGNQDAFLERLRYIAYHVPEVNELKRNCIEKAQEYSPAKAVLPLVTELQ